MYMKLFFPVLEIYIFSNHKNVLQSVRTMILYLSSFVDWCEEARGNDYTQMLGERVCAHAQVHLHERCAHAPAICANGALCAHLFAAHASGAARVCVLPCCFHGRVLNGLCPEVGCDQQVGDPWVRQKSSSVSDCSASQPGSTNQWKSQACSVVVSAYCGQKEIACRYSKNWLILRLRLLDGQHENRCLVALFTALSVAPSWENPSIYLYSERRQWKKIYLSASLPFLQITEWVVYIAG